MAFNVEEYKKKLNAAKSCETCPKIPCPDLGEKTRYVFISYSHDDYKKVYADLAELYARGVPFWYDEGLPAGKNWDIVVREKMMDARCAGVIFYLSENLCLSSPAQIEIRIARGEDGDNSLQGKKREYFSVNLTNEDPFQIRTNVMSRKQFSDIEDKTAAQKMWFITLANAFHDRTTYLPFDNPNHISKLVEQINVNFGINPNYNLYDFEKAKIRTGSGVIEFVNGSVYEGAFANGLFSGQGTLTDSNGGIYKGEWKNGKRHGYGILSNPDGFVHEGRWEKGLPLGFGKATYPDGAVYIGQWKDGYFSGQGIMNYPDGSVYNGCWEKGNQFGYGMAIYHNGSIYSGEWVNGNPCGQGTYIRGSDGHKHVGTWGENGVAGYGTYIYPDGASRSGNWDGDLLLEGGGVFRYPDGSSYNGQIKNNLRHGIGTYTLPDGTIQSGRFENDQFIGPAE